MKLISKLRDFVPSPVSAALSAVSAAVLVLAFPDFEYYRLAFVAFVPLLFAIRRESESPKRAFTTGWIFGTVFFFGTCWWLTFAPITYAHLPWPPVYFLMLGAALGAGVFPAIFAAAMAIIWRRFGFAAVLLAPVVWVGGEFLRMWISGNNWNAAGYALAFSLPHAVSLARVGGVYAVSFFVLAVNVFIFLTLSCRETISLIEGKRKRPAVRVLAGMIAFALVAAIVFLSHDRSRTAKIDPNAGSSFVAAIQPNVPMDGLTRESYRRFLDRHVELAEEQLKLRTDDRPSLVIFPESPMLFQYGDDAELREFFRKFAERNRTAVLFNSAEPSPDGRQLMNSAVMINDSGAKVGQYDKIFLLPFGEFIPFPEPVASWMPAFVGNFKKGSEYDLLPVGDAKAGVMICFESHFGGLSGEYARNGADLLIEMTNDGYLGQTPVLRQHLANTVFRAIETNRPVLRVTNVGITAYIGADGSVNDAAGVYADAARLWPASRLVSGQTIYARIGDAFAIVCSLVAVVFTSIGLIAKGNRVSPTP